MTPTSIPEPEVQSLGTQIESLTLRTEELQIVTPEAYTSSCELLKGWTILGKQIDEAFDPQIEAFHKGHKIAIEQKKKFRGPVDLAISRLKLGASKFLQEQERVRREEERRQQEIVRARAEAEAKRLSEEQALNDALELEAAGDSKGAEAVLANPSPVEVYVPPIVVPRQVPRAEGISTRQNWKFRITNPSLVPREYLIVDEKAIGHVVRALKDKAKIPGVEVYSEDSVAVRA